MEIIYFSYFYLIFFKASHILHIHVSKCFTFFHDLPEKKILLIIKEGHYLFDLFLICLFSFVRFVTAQCLC